jgi:5'-3' exonuclease
MAAAKATLHDIEQLKHGVGHVIICRDAPPYKARLAIFAEYKANRPVPEPEERAQKRFLYSEMQRLSLNVAWCQGFEADDVIATLAKEYAVWCQDVRIVGTDKDCAQCLTAHVTQYVPPIGDKDWEVRDVAAAIKKFGVRPELMPLYQGLVGDNSDNIPGVPRIGPKTAAELVNKYPSLSQLAAGLATEAAVQGSKPSAVLSSLATHWESLVMSLKLATLDTTVPLDSESLLVVRKPLGLPPARNTMDVELDGFTGNETPVSEQAPPVPRAPSAPPPPKMFAAQALEMATSSRVPKPPIVVATELYQEKFPPQAAKDAGLLEKEYDREREQNAENDTTSNDPGDKASESVVVPRRAKPSEALAKTEPSRYGVVTADLQPMDLTSAYHMSTWFIKGGLYPQFKTEAQIFTIMVRAKELGIGVTTALAGFHMVDSKPVASADLIRALCERDATFEYLYPKVMTAERSVWVGKRKGNPEPVEYEYTIAEAQLAGLVKTGNYGKGGNWQSRPKDMLVKTAGSKLARLLWPAATMGLYCPEEMGYTADELDAREAA